MVVVNLDQDHQHMTDAWLDGTDSAQRLGVKPQTLYAYVSRGLLRARTSDGSRESLYLASDIENLSGERRRGRKPKEVSSTDGEGKKHKATAFSWEKTDKAEALRKAAKL